MKPSSSFGSKQARPMSNEEIQNALNDWMDKIEKQINQVEDTVYSKTDARTQDKKMKDF